RSSLGASRFLLMPVIPRPVPPNSQSKRRGTEHFIPNPDSYRYIPEAKPLSQSGRTRFVKRLSFRARLLWILLAFAIVPSVVLMLAGTAAVNRVLPRLGGSGAWERVAQSGRVVASELDSARLTAAQRRALRQHEQELNASLEQARRIQYLAGRAPIVIAALALIGLGILVVVASRVAAHLSRQLSRPLNELVGWAGRIAKGLPLPDQPPRKR